MASGASSFTDARELAPLGVAAKVFLVAEVVAAHTRARAALRRESDIRNALRALRGNPTGAAGQPQSEVVVPRRLAVALRMGRAVARTLRYVPGDTRCLAQSLTLIQMLSRRGIEAELILGVRPGAASAGDEFVAHAWVEVGAIAVLPSGDGEYDRLVTL